MRFILLDETIVDRGFWVFVSGIQLERFKKNPVMYWMHQRPSRWESKDKQMLPIGRWDDLKIEIIKGVKSITGEAMFDESDDFALTIKKKVDGNFIRMASAGLRPITTSEEAKFLKPGQTRATLVKSEMIEASIVDIGANQNAVRLYSEDGETIDLASENENIVPFLNKKKEHNMKILALKLGLKEDATEVEILAKIEELQASEKQSKELSVKLQNEMVLELLKSEAITADNKTSIEKLAKSDFNLAKETIKILEEKGRNPNEDGKSERLSSVIRKKKTGGKEEKKWDDYSEGELQELRANKREDYISLFSENFGYEPIIND